MNNYIFEYYQGITDGTITVGRWIRMWYEKIVHGIESGDFYYSAKAARRAIAFVETFCRHHEGALAPQRIRLELWQKALISVLFGIVDENGFRWIREAVVIIGRKNGKTLLAAALSAYAALMDREYGARVYMVAPKLDQAALCYDAFFQMIQKDDELSALAKKRRTDIYFADTNSSVRPLAFSSKKSDGLNISFCVADEIASWTGDQGIKFYEVLRSSFGSRRQPLMLCISTAGYVNDGIYDELMKRCTAVLKGSSQETRLAPFLYIIDDEAKWDDINELQKSNPNLGVSVSVDYMLNEISIAKGSLPKLAEFKTKYCNIKQNSASAWLDFKTVADCMGEPERLEDFRNCYAVGGLDLSKSIDLTAASIIVEKDRKIHVFCHFWMPQSRLETATAEDGVPYQAYIDRGFLSLSGENQVDYHDVYRWFTDMIEKYKIYILQIGYDRYSAPYLVADLKAYGFHCDDVYQGSNLSPVIDECGALMMDGRISFGDNSLLQSHFLNVALKSEPDGRNKMVKIGNRTRIDGAAAVIDALTVRQKYYAEIGRQLENRGK